MENIDKQTNPFIDVLFVVLLYKNEDFNVRAPYDIDILGKKMWEWVALTGSGAKIKTTPCTKDTDIISLIKPFVTNEKYTFILYSDTPLITRKNVLEIFEYFKQKDLSVLKLKRGYVFNNNYLLNCDSILSEYNPLFDGEEFEPVDSFIKLAEVRKKLQKQIIKYHQQNGVDIFDENTVYIDAGVVIEKGVKIYPNNYILMDSYIGENSVLEPNNVVNNSIISANVLLKGAYILNSRISENTIVPPFDKIIDKNI